MDSRSFPTRGPQVDLLAPGVAINSSVPGGNFEAFNGTSMATPHVAGAFAALRSLAPRATVADIERALSATGVAVGDRPRIAMLAAARALQAQATAEPSMTPGGSPERARSNAAQICWRAFRPIDPCA